jgi:acetyltransferase-like isoleucine patch superfamily enzyme
VKTTFRDFVAGGICCTIITLLAIAIALGAIRPLTDPILHDYHILVEFFAGLLSYGLLSALAVRMLVAARPLAPGEYDDDDRTFARWKLLTVLHHLGQAALTPFTPVFARPLVAKLFGARIGRDIAIGGRIDDPWLVTIGDGVVLGNNSLVSGNMLAGGKLVLGRVSIGDGSTVGVNCVVMPGVTMGARTTLIGGAIVSPKTTIPDDETWRGNPARKWR